MVFTSEKKVKREQEQKESVMYARSKVSRLHFSHTIPPCALVAALNSLPDPRYTSSCDTTRMEVSKWSLEHILNVSG